MGSPFPRSASGFRPSGLTVRGRNVDELLARLAQSQAEEALLSAVRQPIDPHGVSGSLAASLLTQTQAPRHLAAIDKLLAKHNIALGQPMGYGSEAMVFEAGPHVVKLGRDPFESGPYQLPDIPGSVPYFLSAKKGPFRVGVQPRALEVLSREAYSADHELARRWMEGQYQLQDSLDRRGWKWDDPSPFNFGIMEDGTMAAFDGQIKPGPPSDLSRRKYETTEDAIRALLRGR